MDQDERIWSSTEDNKIKTTITSYEKYINNGGRDDDSHLYKFVLSYKFVDTDSII